MGLDSGRDRSTPHGPRILTKVTHQVIRLIVNGESRELKKEATLADLLEEMGTSSDRVAVELNLRVLDKQEYDRTILRDGDRLEIISFVGGG
jgi:sulfur carrier protein